MGDWITDFVELTKHVNSPELFKKWAAISILSGALERKVWVRTRGSNLYPNLYILIVAPPGIGKTEVTWRIRAMWKSLSEHHVAPSSITKASLIDCLNDAKRGVTRPTEVPAAVMFNSLLIASNELGVLLPSYDYEFMNVLTDLYDCKNYEERRRTRDINIEIKAPHVTMVAACTPSYLTAVMPEGAWDQGFAARLILIYSAEQEKRSLFTDEAEDEARYDALKASLKKIGNLYGKMVFTPEAATAIDNWYMNNCAPVPDYPKLIHYNTRRIVHALKLSIIAAVSETCALRIELHHVQRAIDWLIEAELFMPDIFKEMSGTSHSQLIEETWYFIFTTYNKEGKKAVPKARVINFLQQRTPAHNVARVLEVMEAAAVIKKAVVLAGEAYVPQGKPRN